MNGTLVGEEKDRVAEHLGTCLTCRRELRQLTALLDDVGSTVDSSVDHVPSEDLVQHALGLLPATATTAQWSSAAIEQHLEGCQECRELAATVCEIEADVARQPLHSPRRRRETSYPLVAAAAAVAGVVGLGAFQAFLGDDPLSTEQSDVVKANEAGSYDPSILFAEGFENAESSGFRFVVQEEDPEMRSGASDRQSMKASLGSARKRS